MDKYDKRFFYIMASWGLTGLCLVILKLAGLINTLPHYMFLIVLVVPALIAISVVEYKYKNK